MVKKIFTTIFILLSINSLNGATWSLTRTDMITPSVTNTTTKEMQDIHKIFTDINNFAKSNIDKEIENKNKIAKVVLNNRVIQDTLIKEVKELNEQINQIIFLKQGIVNDLPIN